MTSITNFLANSLNALGSSWGVGVFPRQPTPLGMDSVLQNAPPSTQLGKSDNQAPGRATKTSEYRIGSLSANFEAVSHDPGTVSTGKNDPGGVSYGLFQMASKKGVPQAFINSRECSKWAHEFKGLTAGTPQFSAAWKSIAAREPQAFGDAQYHYIKRTSYDKVVSDIQQSDGLDVNSRSNAIKEVVWSSRVQSGGAASFISRAIQMTDAKLARTHNNYDLQLLHTIYDQRTAYMANLRTKALKEGRKGDASTFANIISTRMPRERALAVQMLEAERAAKVK